MRSMINQVIDAGTIGDLSTITGTIRDQGNKDERFDLVGVSAPLYGRKKESELLLHSFCTVSQESQIVIVHGKSGSGKTSLVNTLRESVVEVNGYFCAGKYFQNSGVQEPYSAVMAAFSDLCDLVAQSSDFAENRVRIQELLGSDGELLRKAVTNLSPFLKESLESIADTRSEMVFAKFKKACKTFLKAMSSAGSIVMFLDDIQWMDEGSKQLVELFTRDTDLKNVMIVLTYRDEDFDNVPRSVTVEQQGRALDVGLDDLDPDTIFELMSTKLKSNNLNTRQLSDVMFAKTGGNPFYVTQFLDAIEHEGLLSIDPTTREWVFNADTIQTEIMVADSLADLLLRKIRRLDPHVQDTLKVASVLGFRFDQDILLEVASSEKRIQKNTPNERDLRSTASASLEALTSWISVALGEGFIEKTKDRCQFSHDKLQEAFYQMLDLQEEERLHYLIGQAYLGRDGDECVYHAAAHLNRAPCTDVAEQEKLASINLGAAKYCRDKSAFLDAASFLRKGLALIDPVEKWRDQYDLSFEMTESLARLELITGNLEASKILTREVLQRARSKEMEFEARLVDMEIRMAGNEIEESIATAREALAVLNVKIPRKVRLPQLIWKVFQVKKKLGNKTDEDILGLPLCEDKSMEAATRLLMNFCLFCFLKGEGNLAIYVALVATELTLLRGLTPNSGTAFIMLGVVECSSSNHGAAYRFGNLGKQLSDSFGSHDTEAAAYGVWGGELKHWREPVRNIWDPMSRAVRSGFDSGNMVWTGYTALSTFGVAIYIGTHLAELETFMRNIYNRFLDLRQGALFLWGRPPFQMVLNLLSSDGDTKDLLVLTGEVMDETSYLAEIVETGHLVFHLILYIWKSQIAIQFGAFEKAEQLYTEMMSMEEAKSYFWNFSVTQWYFHGFLVHVERYRVTSDKRKLRKARWFKKQLKKIHKEGCPNALHYLTAIAAEELALKKKVDKDKLLEAYTVAANGMATQEMPQMEAICNERAGFAFARLQCKSLARRFFDRSLDLFLNGWGAVAKYEHLQARSSLMLSLLTDDVEQPDAIAFDANNLEYH